MIWRYLSSVCPHMFLSAKHWELAGLRPVRTGNSLIAAFQPSFFPPSTPSSFKRLFHEPPLLHRLRCRFGDLPFLFYRRVVSASQSVHNRGLLTSEELEYPIGINSRLHPDQSNESTQN